MRGLKELTAVALSLAGVAIAEDIGNVKALQKDNFESFVSEHPLVLAEFYAPWCGHCKALAPEYEDAATKLKDKNIPLVKVDCTEEADLCEKHGVQGYPTVKVFRGPENSSPYSGQRKSDSIVSYMIKQSLPAVSVLDKDTIEEFKKADKVVVIAYFANADKVSNTTYTEAAESLRDNYLFGATSDMSLAEEAGLKVPAIVLYKTFDEGKDVYDSKFNVDAITKFAKTASTPLIGEVGPETYAGYMDAGIPLAYIFFENDESREKLTTIVRPLAIKHKGKINFATIDAASFGAHAGNLNLEQKWPAFAIQETAKNQKFPFDQDKEITEKALTEFIDKFIGGKIPPSIKSEPIPETNDGPVTVVVANNYQELVIDSDKDVLLEFYAPWCGHCKNLAPKYEELGALYASNPDFAKKVTVAKVDATNNDVPVEISGFPTIKLFPAGAKGSPVDYSGSRTIEDLAKFVMEHGKYKVDAYVPPKPEAESSEEAAQTLGDAAKAASKLTREATEKIKNAAETVITSDDGHDEL